MTNKEAIDWLGLVKQRDVEFDDYSEDTKKLREKAIVCFQEALNLGIKALENQKVGHWTYIKNSSINGLKVCECSNCNKRTYGSHNYCSNCGAKMEIEE